MDLGHVVVGSIGLEWKLVNFSREKLWGYILSKNKLVELPKVYESFHEKNYNLKSWKSGAKLR